MNKNAEKEKFNSFYNLETLGGILLFIAAVMAIIVANSPYRFSYDHLLHLKAALGVGNLHIQKPLLLWVNDGLMAIYFLLIGLEIKREIKRGVLREKKNLVVVIDLFSRKVVGWSMSSRMTAGLVCGALRMAIWQRKPAPGLIVHSVRGSQYASFEYRRY